MARASVIILSLFLATLSSSAISFRAKKSLVFVGHKKSITSISFTADSNYILTSSNDMSLKLWNSATGRPYKVYKGHGDWVTYGVLSKNGHLIASASLDKTIRIWNRYNGKTIKILKGLAKPADKLMFIDRDRKILALSFSSRRVTVFDIKTSKITKKIKLPTNTYLTAGYISPDGRYIAFEKEGLPAVFDLRKNKITKGFKGSKHTAGIKSIIISPDFKKVITGGGSNVKTFDCSIKVWDIKSGKEIKSISGHDSDVYVGITPISRYIVSASTDRSIMMWDIIAGKKLGKLSAKYEAFWCIAVSRNKKLIAAGSVGGYIAIFKNKYF